MSQSAITPLRVRVTATYGPVMPSLGDLTGEPPEGYEKVVAFIRAPGACPSNWNRFRLAPQVRASCSRSI